MRSRRVFFERMATNASIALVAVLLFHLLSVFSGKIDVGHGLGWDGRAYAEMATLSLDEGNANTRARPLMVLLPKALLALGADVIDAFLIPNYFYAFALALAICALLDLSGLSWPAKLTIVANIALCIAPSKMFAFYPVQIDLGTLALITWTFYLATSGRPVAAACCGVFAAASREFSLAALLYGAVCAWRGGYRPWTAAALYLPAFAVLVAVRTWAIAVGGPTDIAYVSALSALQNLQFWQSPLFALMFVYFVFTLLGGLSMALLVRPAWLARQVVERPELLAFIVPVAVATIAGNIDIWRYGIFGLPVVIVLFARYVGSVNESLLPRMMIVITLATIVTQRPFEQMNVDIYFRNWFPVYQFATELGIVWPTRILSTVLLGGALAAMAAHLSAASHRPGGQTAE